MNPYIEQLVAFAILMGAGDEILDRSPEYIRDKFNLCTSNILLHDLAVSLDSSNRSMLQAWCSSWLERCGDPHLNLLQRSYRHGP